MYSFYSLKFTLKKFKKFMKYLFFIIEHLILNRNLNVFVKFYSHVPLFIIRLTL